MGWPRRWCRAAEPAQARLHARFVRKRVSPQAIAPIFVGRRAVASCAPAAGHVANRGGGGADERRQHPAPAFETVVTLATGVEGG